ncbi:hypothetical protein JW905_09645, partial [bacterium]|nr:hypothetical protein [candidate division CSSED10-310 bacterium]
MSRLRISLCFMVFTSLVLATCGLAETHVSGTISVDTTWTAIDSPYVIDSDVTVSAGSTLTLEPGAIVKFQYNHGSYSGGYQYTVRLLVYGILDAQGTAGDPICFTSIRDDSVGGDTNG